MVASSMCVIGCWDLESLCVGVTTSNFRSFELSFTLSYLQGDHTGVLGPSPEPLQKLPLSALDGIFLIQVVRGEGTKKTLGLFLTD